MIKKDYTINGSVLRCIAEPAMRIPFDNNGALHGEVPGKGEIVLRDMQRGTFIIAPLAAAMSNDERVTVKIYSDIPDKWIVTECFLTVIAPSIPN